MPLRTRIAALVLHVPSLTVALALSSATEGLAQVTTRVNLGALGAEADEPSRDPAISADGRFVAFSSSATNLVPGVANMFADILIVDRETGAIELVSRDPLGEQGDRSSVHPALSADARFVAFESMASNLVPGDTNDTNDVFVLDRGTGDLTRASTNDLGEEGNGPSVSPSISADGRWVVFSSAASNLVPADTNGFMDIFVKDRLTGAVVRASVDSAGQEAAGNCFWNSSISADGACVAFFSAAPNLVPGDSNGKEDVFVRDLAAGTTERVSVSTAGDQGNGLSSGTAISGDGRFVAFASVATNLVAGDTNGVSDVFVRDRLAGETTRVSVGSGGVQGNGASQDSVFATEAPAISADGRRVAFFSVATNLVPSDNAVADVFVHDRLEGETIRVSQSTMEAGGDAASTESALAGESLFVAFTSLAANLVTGDTNAVADVFVRDFRPVRAGGVNAANGRPAAVLTVNGASGVVAVARRAPFEIALAASPAGPDPARYALWVWGGALPSRPYALAARGFDFGFTFLPTPLQRPERPQPIRCLRGTGIPALVCRGVPEASGPARAPWSVLRNRGFGQPIRLVFQGVLEDDGSESGAGFSLTNAIILQVF